MRFLPFIIALLEIFSQAQRPAQIVLPEQGFVSPTAYTSAYFGFTLPLPKDKHFHALDLSASDKALQHFLFAEKSDDRGLTLLLVSAVQVFGPPDEEAKKAAALPGMQGGKGVQGIPLAGKVFWKLSLEEKAFSGKLYRARYTVGVPGYVVQFAISSYNSRLFAELINCIEAISFFDPAVSAERAGKDGHPYLPEQARIREQSANRLDLEEIEAGRISGDTYRNVALGFSYEFPEGWEPSVPREAELKQTSGTRQQAAMCTRSLLWLAPRQHSDGFNGSIAIFAANPECFAPDLPFPSSVRDKEQLQRLGEALVRAFAGTRFMGRDASRLRAVQNGQHIFLEMPSSEAVPVPGSTLLRKVHVSFVLTEAKGFWLIWLFESETESGLARLMQSGVNFSTP